MNKQGLGPLFTDRRFTPAYRFLARYSQPDYPRPEFLNAQALGYEIAHVLSPKINQVLRIFELHQPDLRFDEGENELGSIVPNIGGLSLLHAHRINLFPISDEEPQLGVWAATSRPHPNARLNFLYLARYTTEYKYHGSIMPVALNEVIWERDSYFTSLEVATVPAAHVHIDMLEGEAGHDSIQSFTSNLIGRVADLTAGLTQFGQAA